MMTLLALYAFMLIPVWIPLSAMAVGAVMDAIDNLRGQTRHHDAVMARRAALREAPAA